MKTRNAGQLARAMRRMGWQSELTPTGEVVIRHADSPTKRFEAETDVLFLRDVNKYPITAILKGGSQMRIVLA